MLCSFRSCSIPLSGSIFNLVPAKCLLLAVIAWSESLSHLELLQEPERATYPTDLWSLGVSLFELVTATLPFEAESDLLYGVAVLSPPATKRILTKFRCIWM
jgi:serine/threonine protein kinase